MLLAYAGAIVILLVLPPQYWARWLTTIAIGLLLSIPYFLALLVRHALRRPALSAALLVAAIGVVLLSSFLDVLRWLGAAPYSSASLSILAMPLLSLAFGTLLIERLVGFTRNEIKAAETLRVTVARQAEQLTASFAALKEQGERLVVLEERRRIARDMHDGVGSHLVSVSALLKSGPAMGQAHMAGLVDAALHELRSVLDVLSAQPASHDDDDPVSTLLARCAGASPPSSSRRALRWPGKPTACPPASCPATPRALHLLRLLQETFTNIVKHAHASTVRFRSCQEGGHVLIDIADDGIGMPAPATGAPDKPGGGLGLGLGLGLTSMHHRATQLGATLTITNASPGTRVTLRF